MTEALTRTASSSCARGDRSAEVHHEVPDRFEACIGEEYLIRIWRRWRHGVDRASRFKRAA